MTGEYLTELMQNATLKVMIAKHARRYSSRVENQEEYIQDAWLRIAEHPEGKDLDYYEEQGRKAIEVAYRNSYNRKKRVERKNVEIFNGISVTGKEKKKIPERGIILTGDKYLDPKPETLDWQYYEGQEREIEEKKIAQSEWYKQYSGYNDLQSHEQKRVENKFMNSGYFVGSSIGGTMGKKSTHYKIVPMSIGGVVVGVKAPPERSIKDTREVGGGPVDNQNSLDSWRELRRLGGTDDWITWLDNKIVELEHLFNG